MSVAEIDEGVYESTAIIDNGSFGTRTIRFETGRLAQQAAGSVVAYLDDETMLLSATTASKSPKEHFDFFPLTVDVEERMYAAGRIPGSFFRREGRPSTDAILTCRLIDRPLRPSFVYGLRNEIQVVVTILSPGSRGSVRRAGDQRRVGVHPDWPVCRSPARSAACGSRLINGTWVAFPTVEQLERAVFDMVVAGRMAGDDVAIMMVEAEATENVVELIAGGSQAPDRSRCGRRTRSRQAVHQPRCATRSRSWRTGRQADRRVPGLPRLPGRRVLRGRRPHGHRRADQGAHHRRQGRAQRAHRGDQGRRARAARPRRTPGARKRSPRPSDR